MAKKRVTVTNETDTGRNTNFHDNRTNENMTRAGFVKKIKKGDYPKYHVRKIHGTKTPVSNPNNTEGNNLG